MDEIKEERRLKLEKIQKERSKRAEIKN